MCPAVGGGVYNPRLSICVQRRGTFLHGGAVDFEVFGWFRDDGDVSRNGDEVVAELLHAERLVGDAMEAGEDKEVAVFVEAGDGRVDAPFCC